MEDQPVFPNDLRGVVHTTMDRIQHPSWTVLEKHGGPAHRSTAIITVTVAPITKPTQSMDSDSDSDSSDSEEPHPVPISNIDRESAIVLAVLAFLCIVACFWFYRNRSKIQRRADPERQLPREREYGVEAGRRPDMRVKSASISFQMKSRSKRTDSGASKGNGNAEVKETHQQQFSWPKITFYRASEPAAPSRNDVWHRQDSAASTIAPRSLDEYAYHERGRSFSYRPTCPRYRSRVLYCDPLPPYESALRRSSISQVRYANRRCTDIGPHGAMPPNQDWPRHQSLREPAAAYNAPDSIDGTVGRNRTHVSHRGRRFSRRVYGWSRPSSTSPSRPGERGSRGMTLGGF